MLLSDKRIIEEVQKGNISIDDFDMSRLNPNSYNLRLHNELLAYDAGILDLKKENKTFKVLIPESGFNLVPGRLYLGRTRERTATHGFVPMIEGRSSLARLGLLVHMTAGFGDNGFVGYWTLEISCVQPIRIYPNVDICQIYYQTIDGECIRKYEGKYQNNEDIQASMSFLDFPNP